jgi:uncharacterized protein (TIGR03067 family)
MRSRGTDPDPDTAPAKEACMSRRLLAILGCALGLFALTALTARTARADDLDKWQGAWRVVAAQVGGDVAGTSQLKKMRVTVDGNKLILEEGPKTYTVHFALDPESHQVDFYKDAGRKEKLWLGIYELDGKELKLCWGPNGAERPKEFEVKKGTDQRYYVISKK